MNKINIDLDRTISEIDPNIFGGYLEHGGRVIYSSLCAPNSPLADENGLRSDVREGLDRLRLTNMRYPGGNFASGYRWIDGVGPKEERPVRHDLAWDAIESNQFGTNEFIKFCRKLKIEPCLCVNCGDGDMREAADWVEYCNGTRESSLAKLRKKHGFKEPHKIKYWGIGNEVDSVFQIGHKTPQEYARAVTEYGKMMKRVDPNIKIIASAACLWDDDPLTDWAKGSVVERAQLMLEQAFDAGTFAGTTPTPLIDYMSLHRYAYNVRPEPVTFEEKMVSSESIEEILSSYEGLIRAIRWDTQRLTHGAAAVNRPVYISFDEWGVWKQAITDVQDALVIGMFLNAFIRHSYSVRMANFTPTMQSLAPMDMGKGFPDKVIPQTIFYPFELYRNSCGKTALDVWWQGDTFAGGECTGVRVLDVSATLDESRRQLVVYVVNRAREATETLITLAEGEFAGSIQGHIINGPDITAANTPEEPNNVGTRKTSIEAAGRSLSYAFEPHSVTALVCAVS